MFSIILKLVGLGSAAARLAAAPTLEVQRREWEAAWPVGTWGPGMHVVSTSGIVMVPDFPSELVAESTWLRARGCMQIRFLRHGPRWLVNLVVALFSWIFFNRFVLWWALTALVTLLLLCPPSH